MNLEQIEKQIKEIEIKMNDPHLCEGTSMVYTRVTGYYRPVEYYNSGKQQEFIERLEYLINNN